mmetsp:Transcript_39728/g.67716  ORF Transcript_39728/g.67716 Transcript_39728/m.67716 type:complete len:114 (+) Transcript_39728:857-1198(+)
MHIIRAGQVFHGVLFTEKAGGLHHICRSKEEHCRDLCTSSLSDAVLDAEVTVNQSTDKIEGKSVRCRGTETDMERQIEKNEKKIGLSSKLNALFLIGRFCSTICCTVAHCLRF